MARPERNTVDYFPFYCDDGKKMFYIEETYGNDGFATFIKILKELAKSEYHYLDLSQNITLMFLSAKCKISKEVLVSIINDLVDLGKFDSVLWSENKIIWCEDFTNSVSDAYLKRNNKPLTYEGLLLLLVSKGVRKPSKLLPTSTGNTQRKEKEIKEEKIKEKCRLSYESNSCEFGTPFKKVWFELIGQPKWFKKNQSAINKALKQIVSYDETFAIALVEKSIAGNYQGIVFAETENHYKKYLSEKNGKQTSTQSAIESRSVMAELATKILTGNQT